jgi:uncharacterized repeat protein (TIGR03803 family)
MKIIALLVLLSAACYAQVNFTTVTSFNGTNGSTPGPSALIVDNSGNLWGTTEAGGSNNAGTVFEISGGCALNRLQLLLSGELRRWIDANRRIEARR